MPRPFPPHQLHRVLDETVQHGQTVADAAGAAGEVDDEGARADAGGTAGERGAREAGVDCHPERLRDAGRLLVEHGTRGLGRDVARREAGAAGGEDEVGPVRVGPGSEDGRDSDGIVGHQVAPGEIIAVLRRPGGDRVARGIGAIAAGAGVGDGEDG